MKISTDKTVFEGENIIAYDSDTYIVYGEDGQGELVIPSIEIYEIQHLARAVRENGSVDALCPNMSALNHEENKWSRIDENTAECSVCGSKLDMRSIGHKAVVKE